MNKFNKILSLVMAGVLLVSLIAGALVTMASSWG